MNKTEVNRRAEEILRSLQRTSVKIVEHKCPDKPCLVGHEHAFIFIDDPYPPRHLGFFSRLKLRFLCWRIIRRLKKNGTFQFTHKKHTRPFP